VFKSCFLSYDVSRNVSLRHRTIFSTFITVTSLVINMSTVMHRRGFQQSLQTQAIEILRVYGTAVHGYVSSLTAVYRLTRGTLSNFSPETANVI